MLALLFVLAAANPPAGAAAAPPPGVHVFVDVHNLKPGAPVPVVAPSSAASAAQKFFAFRCSICHGSTGLGDGPSATGLPQKPRRFSDAVWQASVSDDDIAAVILGGGAARKLSSLMPANVDLKDKPELVRGLVAFIRGLRSPNGSVRATLTSPGKPAIVASADASNGGAARVDLARVPAGQWQLLVESAPGTAVCQGTVVVGDLDLGFACPALPSPALAERKSP